MSIDGTDVSGWQSPTPNYGANQFVVVKATEGITYVNQNHAQQVASARTKKLGVGHYHFANGKNTPEAEARYFFSHCDWKVGEILALDLETPFYNSNPPVWAAAFFVELHRLSGIWGLLYINGNFRQSYNWTTVVNLGVGLWLAAYNNVGPGDPAPWAFAAMWQNSNADETSGGDDNIFFGTLEQFRKYGTPPIVVKPEGTPVALKLSAPWNLPVQEYAEDGRTPTAIKPAGFILGQINQWVTRILKGQAEIKAELAEIKALLKK